MEMMRLTMQKIGLWLLAGMLSSGTVYAQKAERKNVREGNKLYTNEQYTEAEIAYRKGLDVNPRSFEGTFNLGNALYKQQKFPEAAEQYQLLAGQGEKLLMDDPANAEKLAQVFHNLGNISMSNQDYAQSIETYKQALRLNPTDDETRYNLALAQKLLEDQEGDGGGGGQDDNQEDQQDQDNQNDQQQQPQQQEQDDNQTQEEEQPNEQMSQDNAQQILDAFLQDEKDTQEKVKQAQQQQQQRRRTDKEW
ncbi:MAG: tetratricopeptide repeat protein [Tannerellaceae bacterium]|nr:tetratricopeptide repeat protein [Tannerellaceae bacterium]